MNLLFIGGISSGIFLFGAIIGLAYLIFWIITLVNAVQSNFKDSNMKLIWIIVIIFASPIGAIVYWLVAPGQKQNNFNYPK